MHGQHIYYYSHSIINIYCMYATFYMYIRTRSLVYNEGGGGEGVQSEILKKNRSKYFFLK